jgi:hypothetical protein
VVAGGYDATGHVLSSVELYDPVTNYWTYKASLPAPRAYHTATLLSSGSVLVVGGFNDSVDFGDAVLYDPVADAWSPGGNLANTRSYHTATLLPTGQVLVAGGYAGNDLLASGELYDPASNTWSYAGSMSSGRDDQTATVLPSGEILIAGGGIDETDTTASAGRYALDLRIAAGRRPVIGSINAPLKVGLFVHLTGSGLDGDSEASGGSTVDSATNSPIVQLRRIDNEQIAWTSPATNSIRSNTTYTSLPLLGIPPGPYLLTVFVNAIPTASQVVDVNSDSIFGNGFEAAVP